MTRETQVERWKVRERKRDREQKNKEKQEGAVECRREIRERERRGREQIGRVAEKLWNI